MSAAKNPPMLAEGGITFERRAGGDFVICTFENGAAIMLSRMDMMRAACSMRNYSVERFAEQPAKIIKFKKKARS